MPKSRARLRLRYMTDPNPEGTPGSTPPAPTPPATFTQQQLNDIAASEKAQGRNAALREVSEKLGMTVEDAAQVLAAAKAADDANKSDAQRDREAAAKEKAEAEAEKAAAAADRHAARVERLLGTAGAANVAVAARAIDVAVGADDATVTAAIEKLKTDAPGLFGAAPTAPHTDPSKPPAAPPAKGTAAERAAAIAASRGYTKPAA
ncbi:hypothetical protein [Cellulomonas taurus]|uniref:hypothetical protein n=1 Tax=Cellulomonas taurus TaxID=2729175 RepID=UPI00145DC022|nr:hypothetical protein [Cellulomonas taurus]